MAAQPVRPKIAERNRQLRNIECFQLSGSSPQDGNATFEQLGRISDDFLAGIPQKKDGFYVLFLPPIGDDFGIYNIHKKPDTTKTGPGWHGGWHPDEWPEPDRRRREILINNYGIPQWFFEGMGWNANGFYGSSIRPSKSSQRSYDIYARFLSKEVESLVDQGGERAEAKVDYGWTFMSFYLICSTKGETSHSSGWVPSTDNLVILLCFDIPQRMCGSIMNVLKSQRPSSLLRESPFSVLPPILFNVVMVEFERGLWTFQAPVRSIEKKRFTLPSPRGTKGDQLVLQLENRYRSIYELLRHALHITETIDVASKNLKAAYEDTIDLHANWNTLSGIRPDQAIFHQSLRTLRFSSNLASSLDHRADAFVDRLRNEAKIVSSLASTRLLNQTIKDGQTEANNDRELLRNIKQLLQQTKNDGAKFAQRISLVTLWLLPGSLVTGFFGMNFFAFGDNGMIKVSKEIYLFFAVTVPITFLCLWLMRPSKKDEES